MNLCIPPLLTIDKSYPFLAQTLFLTQLHNPTFFHWHLLINFLYKNIYLFVKTWGTNFLAFFSNSATSFSLFQISHSFVIFFIFIIFLKFFSLLYTSFFALISTTFYTLSNISLFLPLLFSNQSQNYNV